MSSRPGLTTLPVVYPAASRHATCFAISKASAASFGCAFTRTPFLTRALSPNNAFDSVSFSYLSSDSTLFLLSCCSSLSKAEAPCIEHQLGSHLSKSTNKKGAAIPFFTQLLRLVAKAFVS